MSNLAQFFHDPRRRNLVILALLALISLGAAIRTLQTGSNSPADDVRPALLLPEFAQQKQHAAKITIASNGSTFEIAFLPEKGWVLPQRHSYPAAYEQVQRLLAALATMDTLAAKTAQKEWLSHLGLTGSDSVRIHVSDESGATLADIITGKREKLDDGSGLTGLYVRKANQNQSWLARTSFVPSGDPGTWLDKSTPAIAVNRVRQVNITPISGPAFSVFRSQPNAAFSLFGIPKDRALADPAAPNDIGTMLSDFDFDDARPVQEVDFTKAPRMVTRTFDGLVVTVETTRLGAYYWAHVTAEGTNPASAKEAREIANRTAAWAYRLTPDKGQRLFMTQERMLAPKQNKK